MSSSEQTYAAAKALAAQQGELVALGQGQDLGAYEAAVAEYVKRGNALLLTILDEEDGAALVQPPVEQE